MVEASYRRNVFTLNPKDLRVYKRDKTYRVYDVGVKDNQSVVPRYIAVSDNDVQVDIMDHYVKLTL